MNQRGCGGANPCEWYRPIPTIDKKPGFCAHPKLESWYQEHRPKVLTSDYQGICLIRPADECRARGGFCDVRGVYWTPRPEFRQYRA